MRLFQRHLGRQCAIGSVYWHLPAKVDLKKSHFGKPSLTECTLRHPPCQSELAEAHRVICGTSASLQVHPEDTMYVKIGQVDLRKHILLGNSASMSSRHLRSGPSTVSCVPLSGTCLRRTPTHYIRSAHQCAGRAVYFAAAKYGKAGRPPGVATLVAVRGLVPPK